VQPFKDTAGRSQHEVWSNHDCPPACARCTSAKVLRERRQLEEEQRGNRKRKREEDVAHMVEVLDRCKTLLEARDPTLLGDEDSDVRSNVTHYVLESIWEKDLPQALIDWLERDDGALKMMSDVPFLQYAALDVDLVAALKDRLRITNNEWPDLVKSLNLPDGNSVHYIRAAQQKIDKEMPVVKTPGGRGHQYHNLETYIQWLIQQAPPKDPSHKLLLKFCFNKATLTSGKKIQQKVKAFNLLYPNFITAQVSLITHPPFVTNLKGLDRPSPQIRHTSFLSI